MNVLCIVAHPDDESLFAGMSLAQHAAKGDAVRVVSLGNGVGARGGTADALARELLERSQSFHAACAILGVAGEMNLNYPAFPDQMADTVPQLDINRAVERSIAEHKPDVVYSHHVGDLNIDHRRVAEAVWVATRQGPKVLCMSPEFPERWIGRKFKPNVRSYSTDAMNAKIKACLCYERELRPYPHQRSERALRERGMEQFMEIR